MAATLDPATAPPLDLDRLRADFPILAREVNGHRLVYLDSAATSQKPIQVLDAIDHYYQTSNANAHRSVHRLAAEATELFEQARTRVAAFIDADPRGVVFLRNTTEALNLVAASHARELLQPGDRVVLTVMEHHSNLVPWQLAAQRAGLRLAFIGVTDEGRLDLSDLDELLSPPTRLLSVTQQSNVLGTINDVAALAAEAHRRGVLVCVDAAQAVPGMRVSVRELDVDFYAFSGHKMCGPMGIGVLWARPELLERMPPFLGGGEMIAKVELESSTWNEIPHKFEAGTPDVASAVGLAAACDYLELGGAGADPRPRAGIGPPPPRRPRRVRGDRVRAPRRLHPRGRGELQRRRRPPPRHRHRARPPRHRGEGGPPLLPAADAPAGSRRHREGVDVPLHHP